MILKQKQAIKKFKKFEHITLGIFSVFGIAAISFFFAWMEERRLLVAGTDTDSVVVSVTVAESISIDSPADVTMAPEIVETGSATGSTTWTVETNNSDGWKLELEASASPAMTSGGNSFADYTETVAGTPEAWSVADANSEFGFSAGGSYAGSEYSNGTLFEGFEGTSEILVAQDNEPTPGGGAEVDVNFKAEVGSSKDQLSGTYSATITATATTL